MEATTMQIHGLHHITLVAADAQRTADFYTRVLGLRLVKKTINFDDPGSYHLYFGNADAQPGSLITFFEWPDAPKGLPGIGGTHHFALTVADHDSLLQWKRRLTDLDLRVDGPYDRRFFTSIYFRDPDGQVIEIATQGPGFSEGDPPSSDPDLAQETWPDPVPEITDAMRLSQGMHHLSATTSDIKLTDAFFGGLLGMSRVKQTHNADDPSSAHWFWGSDDGRPGTLVTYFERDPATTRRARIGAGQTHHFALGVKDDEQIAWRERLVKAGLPVSPVMDRIYFKSIYTRDPDGHIVELATLGPGFTVDEPLEHLGTGLMLPPWLEPRRSEIEAGLKPINLALTS